MRGVDVSGFLSRPTVILFRGESSLDLLLHLPTRTPCDSRRCGGRTVNANRPARGRASCAECRAAKTISGQMRPPRYRTAWTVPGGSSAQVLRRLAEPLVDLREVLRQRLRPAAAACGGLPWLLELGADRRELGRVDRAEVTKDPRAAAHV
jgi:hypothetical protein